MLSHTKSSSYNEGVEYSKAKLTNQSFSRGWTAEIDLDLYLTEEAVTDCIMACVSQLVYS